MSKEVARVAIMTHLDAIMAAELPGVSLMRENQHFSYPNPPALFARAAIMPGSTYRRSIGTVNRYYQQHGNLVVELFLPEKRGVSALNAAADALETGLRDTYLVGSDCTKIVFEQPRVVTDGLKDGYYRVTVYVAYYHDIMDQGA